MRRKKNAPPPKTRDVWVPVIEVAARLGITDKAVYDLCNAGRIGHIRHERAVRISERHLREYLKDHEVIPVAS